MSSSRQSLVDRLHHMLASPFMRSRDVEAVLQRTDDRYLDADGWARIRGITLEKAKEQLMQGESLGYFQRCLLYEWPDSPVKFVLPMDYVGKTIRLSEVGYSGDDDTDEVVISPHRVKEVFVAA